MIPDAEHGLAVQFAIGDGEKQALPMSRRGWVQLVNWLGLPLNSRLYKRLRFGFEKGKKVSSKEEHSDRFWPTLTQLINDHFSLMQGKRLLRTLMRADETWYVRACLSDRYRVIPNDQLFLAVADKLKEESVEFWDARLSEDAFYIYAVAPGISAQIRKDRPFNGNNWLGDSDDTVNAALMLRNSETGQGGCEVCPAIITSVDGAYFVSNNRLSLRHVGSRHEMDTLLSASTIEKKNAVIYDEVRDYCVSTFTPDLFQKLVDQMQDATQDEVEDPAAAAEAVRAVYDLPEPREAAIIKWLTTTGDRSRFGLARAVAREARENRELGADEAVRLEKISTDLIANQTTLKLARAAKAKVKRRAEDDTAAVEQQQLALAGQADSLEI